jgi:peroxiredoxin
MKPSRSLSVLCVVAALGGVLGCGPKKDDKPPVPKVVAAADISSLPNLGPAPAWKLQDLNGKPVTLAELKGKVVVLDFWATWCGPCRMEIPGYIEMTKKYGKDGLVIVGASIDQGGPEVVKAFADKMGINYSLVMADEATATAYGATSAIPTTIIIDRNGQVRHRKEGAEEPSEYEPKVLAVLREKA